MPFDRMLSPWGKITTLDFREQPPNTVVIPVYNNLTIVTFGPLTSQVIVAADIDPELRAGAKVLVHFERAANHTISWSDGFRGEETLTTRSTPQMFDFVYNGVEFFQDSYRNL